MSTTFADTVRADVINPIETLCGLLSEEGCYAEFAWFSGILQMLATPEDEASVLTAVIELSQCAFLGFVFSHEAAVQIDQILERAITLSHTMSAPLPLKIDAPQRFPVACIGFEPAACRS